jgi:protein-disulfide isomerase
VKQVLKAYGNKVRVVFKHRPLSFHKQAHLAAQASMAAHAQGKFWPYHDKLFANSRNLSKANMIKWAKELGLDVARFTKELNSGMYSKVVDRDNSKALRVGARGTPTFFVGSQRLVGAQPLHRFKRLIDAVLNGKPSPIAIDRLRRQKNKRRRVRPTRLIRPTKVNPANAKRAIRALVKVDKSDASWGPTDALVTIVKFTDFQCPFCSRGANTMKQVRKAFKGQVRIVYKHNPLAFHKQAHIASQATLAANAQGKFWEYHDKVFANYRSINKANLIKWAGELGLNVGEFKAALDSGKYKAQVNRDLAYGRTVGVRGTPNFFVNGRKVAGAYPFNHFQKIIKEEIAYAKQLMKQGVPKAKIYDKLMEAGKKAAEAERLRKLRAAMALKRKLASLDLSKSPSFGPANAKVTIIEFSDFQCPYCSRGAKVVDQIKKAYGEKVRVVFKHLPLSFHRQAHIAAQASMEAHAQGKFWKYHDKLFANGRAINKANLIKWAKELGLDAGKMKAALDSG